MKKTHGRHCRRVVAAAGVLALALGAAAGAQAAFFQEQVYSVDHDQGSLDVGYGIAAGQDGAATVAGARGDLGDTDGIGIRYDSSGKPQTGWPYLVETARGVNVLYGVAEQEGAVYLAGQKMRSIDVGGGLLRDVPGCYLDKVDASGRSQWQQPYYKEPQNQDDASSALAVAITGDKVYAAGYLTGAASEDSYIGWWDANTGALKKSEAVDVLGQGHDDRLHAIAVDENGDVIVAGKAGTGNNDWGLYLAKYAAELARQVWDVDPTDADHNLSDQDDTKSNAEAIMGLATDPAGNIYAAAHYDSSATGHVWLVRKYDSDGNVVWTKTESGLTDGRAQAILYHNGYLVVGGTFKDNGVYRWRVELRRAATGELLETKVWAGLDNAGLWGLALRGGVLYLTGYAKGSVSGNNDIHTEAWRVHFPTSWPLFVPSMTGMGR